MKHYALSLVSNLWNMIYENMKEENLYRLNKIIKFVEYNIHNIHCTNFINEVINNYKNLAIILVTIK